MSTRGQVLALLRLRAARAPLRAAAGLSLIPVLLLAAAPAGSLLPDGGAPDALLLLPTAWLGFALTVVISAGTGGTRSLLPPDQSVAFPVRPAADHVGALLLAPLTVAWMLPALGLLALGGWAFDEGRFSPDVAPGLALTVLWIVACTCLGQVAGWAAEVLRTTRSGPWLLRGLVAAGVLAAAAVAATGRTSRVLDSAPTVRFIATAVADDAGPQAVTAAGLAAAVVVGLLAGPPLVALLHRRPARDQARAESRRYPARSQPRTALRAALRMDRAGVWRSTPLRRGLLTLAVAPGAAAATTGLDWPMLALLPGLVASGAGLLFGVNAFSLDGSGALWREALPGGSRSWLTARLLVLAEICAGAALLAVALGAVRGLHAPSGGELLAVLGAVVATTAQVLGRCARWSLQRPYPAALRGARDQPAPPAAMAGYSARLAVGTTVTGLLMAGCARADLPALAVAISAAVTCWSARHVVAAMRGWDDDTIRSRVVAAVSAG